ncbi:MAG: hypothetical protein AB7P14_19835 [Blastocatellales bacterium]
MSKKMVLYILSITVIGSLSLLSGKPDLRVAAIVETVGAQSTCTPPLFQGYPSSCSNINLRWLNRDPISMIDHYEIFRGGAKVGEAPASAISFSEPVGCGFGATYTIRQVMKSGATCQVVTTGNPPHTKPCDMCTGGGNLLNLVNSASFNSPVAPNSISTIFANPGQSLTSVTASADSLPLPQNLLGTQVLINGAPAELFYVSPTQINFLMPQVNAGAISVVIIGSNGERTEGSALTGPNPAIFTANSNGSGVAAGQVTTDGQRYQRIFDGNRVAMPVSVSVNGQPNYLVLYGTGIRNQSNVDVKIGGQSCLVTFAGASSGFPGVDQINVRLPESLRGVGTVAIVVTAGGFISNFSQINIGN